MAIQYEKVGKALRRAKGDVKATVVVQPARRISGATKSRENPGAIKSEKGRPPTGPGTPVNTRFDDSELGRIDRWRLAQKDKPSRPEAIRRLVDHALKEPA